MRFKPRSRRRLPWLLLVLAGSGTAFAEGTFTPYASAGAEYNSNLFALPDEAQAAAPTNNTTVIDPLLMLLLVPGQQPAGAQSGDTSRDDTTLRYVAGVETSLSVSDQKLHATLEGRRLQYQRFDHLDHNEYLVDVGADWRLFEIVDGTVNYRRERRAGSFADRHTTELLIENEGIASGSLNLDLTPVWRLETGLRSRELDSPLPGSPEFRLEENAINAAIKYLIEETLAAGVFAEYLAGRFKGVPGAGSFNQASIGLAVDYVVTDLSRLKAELGYTVREDEENDNSKLSGMTGLLSYHRELTGKTTLDLQVFRRVYSFVGGASSVTETGAGPSVTWKPTDYISVTGTYLYTQGQFGEDAASAGNSNREDQSQTATLKLTYQPLPWLAVRPYGEYRTRDSSVAFDNYDATIAGIELQIRF